MADGSGRVRPVTVDVIKTGFRWGVFQLHSLAGLTVGLVLAVMGVTGATMAFEDPIMEALSPGVVDVAPRPGLVLTPDQLLERFKAANPDARPTSITLRSKAGASPQVTFASAAAPKAKARKLYLDPYDGRVLGRATGEAFFATVRQIHRYMLLPGDGDGAGRQITGVAAVCLVLFALSGLYLRWPKRLLDWKVWLRPNLRLKRRGLYWSLHAVIGTWVLPVYLLIALTGLTWSYDGYKAAFERVLTGRSAAQDAPAEKPPKGKSGEKSGKVEVKTDRAVSLDKAVQTAREASGDPAMIVVSIPKSAKAPLRIRTLSADAPNERAFDEWRIDARTGRVIDQDLYRRRSLGEQIVDTRLAVHRGSFFGLPGAIVFMLAAAAMPLFPITGYLLYLGRRRAKAARRKTA